MYIFLPIVCPDPRRQLVCRRSLKHLFIPAVLATNVMDNATVMVLLLYLFTR